MNVQQVDKNSLCRFCVEKVLKPISKNEERDEVLAYLNFIFRLEIFEEDAWPKRICASCKEKSKDCIAFYRSIREAEEKLFNLIGEKLQNLKKEVILEELPLEGLEVKEEILEDEDTKSIKNENDEEDGASSTKYSSSWAESLSAEESEDDEVELEEEEIKSQSPQNIKIPVKEIKGPQKPQEKSSRGKARKMNNDVIKNYLGFKCDICSMKAKSYQALKCHFLSKHGVKGYIICCSKKFTALGRLASHVKIHINPEAFKCPKCSKVLSNSLTFGVHRKECSATSETCTIICKVCSEAFPTPRLLYQHRRKQHLTEEEKPHKCPDCPKRFLMPSHLKYHKMWVHEKKKPYLCATCGVSFTSQWHVEEHVKKTHLKDQQLKLECKHCGRAFIEVRLKEHLRLCNVPLVCCEVCGKEFKNSHSLKKHTKFIHNGIKRKTYSCEICTKTFSSKSKHTDHIAKHQGNPLRQCSFCDKKFYSYSAKNVHERAVHPAEYAAAKEIPKTPKT